MAFHNRTVRTIVLLLIALSCSLLFLFYRQAFAWRQAQKLKRENPTLALVPRPLTDYSANPGPGTAWSRFDYQFEVPWTAVDRVDDQRSLTMILFKPGQLVVFFDPHSQPDLVATMSEAAGAEGRSVFGRETMASNYELRKATLALTPDDVALFMPARDAVRNLVLLELKSVYLVDAGTGLFSVQTPRFRGFQQGDPASGRVILTLFDEQDREFEFLIGMQTGKKGHVTQADVNRIIASLGPIQPVSTEK